MGYAGDRERSEIGMLPARLSMIGIMSEVSLCLKTPLGGRLGNPRVHQELKVLINVKAPTGCQEGYLSLHGLL